MNTRLTMGPRLLGLLTVLVLAASLALAGCGKDAETLVIYSSRTRSLVQPLLERFAAETGVNINVRYDTTASIIATLREEGANARADVVYLAEPSGWGTLSEAGLLATLPSDITGLVDPAFRSKRAQWVGLSGRSKVVVYNVEHVDPARDLPASIMDFTDPKWRGRIGWAPTHGEWQITLTAIRLLHGDDAALAWLEGIKANEPKTYPNLISIVQAVATGEVDVGFVNHYYVPRLIAETGEDFGARNYFLGAGDAGAVMDVAAAGIVANTDVPEAAQRFIRFMLSAEAQGYFATETREYPLAAGVEPGPDLPPLDSLAPPDIDLDGLGDLEGTLRLLREAGVIL
ncbi:MAG: iron ABC transporter substrate-binding protein [Chloroflexota bacterium]